MSVRLQSNNKEGRGDGASYSSDPSCSTPSRSWDSEGDSDRPDYLSDFEEADSFKSKTPEARSPDKRQAAKTTKRKKAKKAQDILKQKTNHSVLRLPPIRPLQRPKQRIQSAHTHRIKELSSQVWDLQHQLSGAVSENKLLKRLQHRHTVALQHFHDAESSLPQVLSKHSNEVQALQELLRNSRACRSSLARQLRAADNELLHTKDSLQHLQLLSQDRSLLEREELAHRLAQASTELDRKDKRILDLEKNLELCQASFSHQIVKETKKTNKATKISSYLQDQINQLTQKIKDREKQLEMHNIYSHRFPKGWNKKGRESKMVQTDGFFPLSIEAAGHLESEYSKAEDWLEGQQSFRSRESFAIEYPDLEDSADDESEDDDELDETERCADIGEQTGCSDQNPEPQTEGGSTEEQEAADAPQAAEREQTEACESQVSYTLENSLNTAQPCDKGFKFPGMRRHYTFKQTIQNLHSGKPAYSSLNESPYESLTSQTRVENLSAGIGEPSFVRLPAGKPLGCGVAGPLCEERLIQNRKSSLMRELFGPSDITDLVSGQADLAEGKSSDIKERLSRCHTDEICSIIFD
ncbi:uncharacterized protein LOC139926233 [Centroberyx gerrardi]